MNARHPLYDICYAAHRNTSFVPERRAEQEIAAYQEALQTVVQHGGDLTKLEGLFRAWMSAKSRCASSMITGPANFNVRRAEKANAGEEKHGKAFYAYLDRVQRPARVPRIAVASTAAKAAAALDAAGDALTAYTVNKEGHRVSFEFNGKPADDVRELLKQNGFKWTPSKGHWGRLLTTNALAAAKRVATHLAADHNGLAAGQNNNTPAADERQAG